MVDILTCHSLTNDNEMQKTMSFLDVEIIREDKKSTTAIYSKLTFRGVYTYFESFLPSTYKFGTVYALAYRCFRVC